MRGRLLYTCFIFFIMLQNVFAQETIPLYEGNIPNNRTNMPNLEKSEIGDDGITRVHNVSIPTISIYKAKVQDPRRISLIIFPGGGYHILSIDKEGYAIANALNEMGITAFVVKYRMPAETSNLDPSIAPLTDAQRAIQLVRQNARSWGIDPAKVGVLGFSAGGHLAAMAATLFDKPVIKNDNHINLRPDFSVLAYPVITFEEGFTHKGSRENLLGKKHSAEQIALFSAEKNISSSTPPAFIFHALDDAAVPVENAMMYFNALRQSEVKKSQLIIYPEGGHGFGLHLPSRNEKWIERLQSWLSVLYP